MAQLQFSAKLSKYLRKVETETSRRIEFHLISDSGGLAGTIGSFRPHPSCILIRLTKGTDWGNPEHEYTIAHEATHGYLVYKLGYPYLRPKRKLTENEEEHAKILCVIVDDIVVNRIIGEEGFPPFASGYLSMVEKETKAARKGSDRLYAVFSHDPLLKDRFMVLRYIHAWGFIRYFDLEPDARRIVNKYLKAFEKSFVRQFAMASQIKEVILQHDIFTAHGRREAVEAVMRLWHLDDLVELQSM